MHLSPLLISMQRALKACALVAALLALPMALPAQYTVGGSASALSGGCYQLTSATNSQAGYVYKNQAINLNEPFDYKFRVYLGTNNGGADGIVFVLRGSLSSPYIGTGGGGLGFNGSGFSSNSLGVEVDTWYNGNYSDMAADHIGILKNGTVNHTSANSLAGPIQASATTANVEDGNYHTLNIRWDPSAEELEVYLDCDYRLQYSGDMIDSIFGGDSTVHWGFLGTTGGANNVQRFCLTEVIDSLVNDLEDVTICNGDSVQLDAGETAISYSWTPSTGLSSTSIADPYASPSNTTTYYVEEAYLCDTLEDTVTVTVIQPTFNVFASVEDALCKDSCNGSIDLTLANGTSTYTYNWSTNDTTQDIIGLCAGTYTVTVQDVDTTSSTYLCTLIEDFTVGEPTLLTSSIINPSKTSCSDGSTCDASAEATASGGTFPYYYVWTSGEVSPIANQLCADTNWVTVTDAHGCSSESYVVIDIPDTIMTTAYGDTMICISNVASIIAASTGGTPAFSYVWREGSLTGVVISTDQTVNVSPSVTTRYFVASTDANGCPGDTSDVLIKVRPPLSSVIDPVDTICPYDTTQLFVEGFGGDSIYTYSWSAGLFGDEIDVSPDEPAWYAVTVSDFCGSPSYVDSVFVQVGGYSAIDATIRVEDDSLCAGEVTHLIASGRGGFRGPDEYRFKWLHNGETDPIQFIRPNSTRTFSVEITDLCLSKPGSTAVTVHVGVPDPATIEVAPKEACAQSDVLIRITDFDKDNDYTWYLGDSTVVADLNVDSFYHTYKLPGCYDIDIASVTEFGCYARSKEVCAIKILAQPLAAFTTDPAQPSNTDEILNIYNASIGAKQMTWFIGEDTIYDQDILEYHFAEWKMPMIVRQVVVSNDGCTDTLEKQMVYHYETLLYYPSAFTPNGDGLNDEFVILGEVISEVDYLLSIYDRWGRILFESKSVSKSWNGRMPDGSLAPQGVYPFNLRYRDHLGELRTLEDKVIISTSGKPIPLR